MDLSFTIPGKLSGKARIRTQGRHFFMDDKTRSAEGVIRHYASEAMKGKELFEGPVLLNVTMWQLIPQSWSNKKKLAASYATGKPDLDNIAKSLADAMNGIVFRDDSQIASLHITRHYGTVEKAVVTVQQLSGWHLRKKVAA
jgi:Holliday junction resolvase RusA-like endonuclease